MWIRTFSKLVEGELRPLALHDTPVVLDGQNFFYDTYDAAYLTSTFGIESNRYAQYLTQYLGMFKKANIKCYFLFKGGHKDLLKSLETHKNSKVIPVFMKKTYRQVLDEMDFDYVVCEYESKKDIVELAQKLNCPVISFNIEFCFSGLQYIPSTTLKFNERNCTIHCGYFFLADFLRDYRLTAEQLALFVALRDERIFPEDTFTDLFRYLKTPPGPFKRNLHLLRWLSKHSKEQTLRVILSFLSAEDKNKFIEEEAAARQFIGRQESGGLAATSLLDRSVLRFTQADPNWFSKGVTSGHIAADYINLYRSKQFLGSPAVRGFETNPEFYYLDLVYYAYDLLTNFTNEGFTFMYDVYKTGSLYHEKETMKVEERSVRKPAYDSECVFENGWGAVRDFGLLEHFVRETLEIDLQFLDRVLPAQARLILLALVIYSRRRPSSDMPSAVLLCYTTLDVIDDYIPSNFQEQTIDAAFKNVSKNDCMVAADIMKEYSVADKSDLGQVDMELVYSLSVFQQSLNELSALNALCGGRLREPILSRTYNGTLMYKLLRAAGISGRENFLEDLLAPAPTVLAFFNALLQTFKNVL